MRIAESTVTMQSSFASVRAERERLEISTPRLRPPERVAQHDRPAIKPAAAEPAEECEKLPSDLKTWLLKLLVEWLSGSRIQTAELDTDAPSADAPADPEASSREPESTAPARPAVELHYERARYESERVDFQAQGVVTTGDGRQIALDLRVGLSREHYERLTLTSGQPEAKDPIVLNFSAASTTLGGTRLSFDLDLDDRADQIALPTAGSAFLALDRNGNGAIDDGSELFGPATGDGFSELATLDADGNGWIDEDDSAFGELRVWDGTDLRMLADAGVGAIDVASVATPFTLGESDATALGRLRSTGTWLGEDGSVHTAQQIDLVI